MNVSSVGTNQTYGMGASSGMGGMKPPPPPPSVDDIISNNDQNSDGSLSVDESGLTKTMFNQIDTDGDGVISAKELQSFLDKKKAEMDANGSGSSSTDQLAALQNQSGIPFMQPPSPDKLISDKDQDGDGKLTIDESGMPKDMFNQIDTDGDGVISAKELQADMDKKKAEMDANKQANGTNANDLQGLFHSSPVRLSGSMTNANDLQGLFQQSQNGDSVSDSDIESLMKLLASNSQKENNTYTALLQNNSSLNIVA